MNKLILICNKFPFGYGEEFLNEEIYFLAEAFDSVEVISRNNISEQTREVPENVKIKRISPKSRPYKLLSTSLKLILEFIPTLRTFIEEIQIIKNTYSLKITIAILKKMFHEYFKASELKYELLKTLNINNNNYTIYSYWQDSSALAAALLTKQNKNIRSICRSHRSDLYFDQNKLSYLPLRHFISSNINKLVFISQNGLNYQNNILKSNFTNFYVSRLGTRKIEETKPKINYSNDNVIVSCSNIITVKRIELIIESLSQITKHKIKWIHIGGGENESNIKTLAYNTLKHKDNISYEFVGRKKNEFIHEFYNKYQIKIFINVSASEGIPVSLMEAISYGIPVIATDVGGTKELVENAGGILLEKDFKISILTNHIINLLEDKEYQMKISDNVQKFWKKEYFADSNFKEFTKLIRDENRS